MVASRIRAVAAGLLLALPAACGAGPSVNEQPTPSRVSRYPHTEADVRFMSAMIGHHAQALQMAALAPKNGASPEILRLAERIAAVLARDLGRADERVQAAGAG